MLLRLLVVLLTVLSFESARADCTSPPQGFGGEWWSRYKAWCRACGGSVPEYHGSGAACTLPEGGASAQGGLSASQSAAIEAVGGAIRGVFEEEARRAAIENREMQQSLNALSQQRNAEADAANARRRAEDANAKGAAQQDVLSQLKTKNTGGLALKPATATPRLDFDAYRASERARRDGIEQAQTLSKADEAWCKLHIPLQPTASTYDAAQQDESRQQSYVARKAEWDRRCQAAPTAR